MQRNLTSVAPPDDWYPDADAASMRFKARLLRRRRIRRRWFVGFGGALLASLALLLIPGTGVLAEQVWEWLTVGRIDIVRVDFDNLSDEAEALLPRLVSPPPPPESVANINEAAQRSGFLPRLPRAGLPVGAPRLSVTGPMSFGTVVRTNLLTRALQKAGVDDAEIRQGWDGAVLRLDVGAVVTADWDGMTLVQARPGVLSAPTEFDLAGFASAFFRAAGVTREMAAFLGQQAASAPALLLGVAADKPIAVRQIDLGTGPATLLEGLGENGQVQWVMVLWSAPDRVYILTVLGGSVTLERAKTLANSVD
jgi:hypothetical protein